MLIGTGKNREVWRKGTYRSIILINIGIKRLPTNPGKMMHIPMHPDGTFYGRTR
jgi:hypothetical protein